MIQVGTVTIELSTNRSEDSFINDWLFNNPEVINIISIESRVTEVTVKYIYQVKE